MRSRVSRCWSWWIAIAVALRHAVGAWQLRETLRWVDRPCSDVGKVDDGAGIRVHVVIPVLREQMHVRGALEWFAPLVATRPGWTLTVVTSARESRERAHLADRLAMTGARGVDVREFPQLTRAEIRHVNEVRAAVRDGVLTRSASVAALERFPTTADVVDSELARLSPEATTAVGHVRYPGEGRKAAQVNYAVEQLPVAGARDYVAIYDVDSRPDGLLLQRTASFIGERQRIDGEFPAVVQQSARFRTHGNARRAWERALCRGAARLQTLWTVRREIPSLRRYGRAVRRPTGVAVLDAVVRGIAQPVGHGLFVRLDVFRELGGLPTFSVLDDVPFGYRLTIEEIPVDCVPFTTVADAPEEARELLAQGRRWFQNYLDYPLCASNARAGGHGTPLAHTVALAVAAYRGATWALCSPAMGVCALLAMTRRPLPVRATAVAGLWLGVVTPVRMLVAAEGREPSVRRDARVCGEVFLAYLLRSLGPLTAIIHRIVSDPRVGALAPKTHRRRAPTVSGASR